MEESKVTWLEEQEFLFWKRWNEIVVKLHWDTYRIANETDNENISLWKKLRKSK